MGERGGVATNVDVVGDDDLGVRRGLANAGDGVLQRVERAREEHARLPHSVVGGEDAGHEGGDLVVVPTLTVVAKGHADALGARAIGMRRDDVCVVATGAQDARKGDIGPYVAFGAEAGDGDAHRATDYCTAAMVEEARLRGLVVRALQNRCVALSEEHLPAVRR
jgi:hypothetical protein